jgi:hypothetical protein
LQLTISIKAIEVPIVSIYQKISTFWLGLLLLSTSHSFELGAGLHLGQNRSYSSQAPISLAMFDFSSFRDEIYWQRIEGAEGVIDVSRGPLPLLNLLQSPRYLKSSMLILGYGHTNYDGGKRPQTPASIAGFKRYALAVAAAAPNVGYLEIWNEWNNVIGTSERSKGDAEGYLRLVQAVAPALRQSNIKAKIVLGAVADDYPNWEYSKKLVNGGILKYADYFSVHLYNYSEGKNAVPREMFARLSRLQEILSQGNDGAPFPILVTEFGWPTYAGSRGFSEAQAGDYISQFLLWAPSFSWIRGAWIYEMFNSGTSNSIEHNFGLLSSDGSPKDSTCKVRGAVKLIRIAGFVKSELIDQSTQWIVYKVGDLFVNVFFTVERDAVVHWSTGPSRIPVIDLCQYAGGNIFASPGSSNVVTSRNEPQLILSTALPHSFFDLFR